MSRSGWKLDCGHGLQLVDRDEDELPLLELLGKL